MTTNVIEEIKKLCEDEYKNITKFVVAEFLENNERKSEFVSKQEYISRKYRRLVLLEDKLRELLERHNKLVLKKIAKGLGSYLELVIFIENQQIKEVLEDISFREAEKRIREFFNIKVKERTEKVFYLRISDFGKIEYMKIACLSNDYVNRKVIQKLKMKDGRILYLVECEDNSIENIQHYIVEYEYILQTFGKIMTKEEFEEFLEKFKDKIYYDYLKDFELSVLKNKKVKLGELEKIAREWYQKRRSAILNMYSKISRKLAEILQRSLNEAYTEIQKEIKKIKEALKDVKEAKKIYNYERELKVLNKKVKVIAETKFDCYFEILP